RSALRPSTATARTVALAVTLAVGALAAAFRLVSHGPMYDGVTMPWWVIAACFAVTETFLFHLEIDEEAHSFTLSEVPLAVGLFFASPIELLVGRLVGELVVLVLRTQQPALKALFNLSTFFAVTVAAITAVRLLC